MAAPKEAIALVLDVSPSMDDAPEGTDTPLQKSLMAINMIIQRKIFSKSKDEVALIVFGTAETNNPLADEYSGYDNITISQELASPDLELLRTVNENISAGPEYADFVDAIVVAMDHLMRKISGRKLEPRIVLFSDLASEFKTDNLGIVIDRMSENRVQLTFVGPEIPEDDDNDDDDDRKDVKPRIDDRGAQNGANNTEVKALTPQQIKGVQCIKGILERIDGEGMSLTEVLPMLSFFQTRSVKQTTVFRGPIEIGDSVKINVYGYVKVKETRASSWGKISALSETSKNPGDMKVSMQRSNLLQDEDFTEVDEENIAKAYKYGKTLVPYSKVDEQSLKLETERCMKVLGFTSRSNINESQYQGESVYLFVPQPGDKDAAVALSALAHALEERDMVAIVRYCRCKNAAPKLAFLTPVIKVNYEGFLMFALPYAEDVRRFPFASLENISVTDDQLNAVDALIDGMNLSKAKSDEDGEQVEAFKPKDILNPLIQRQCQCVQKRALNPDGDEIPMIDDHIKRSIEPIPEQAAACRQTYDKLKELFPLKIVDKKGTKGAANIFQQSEEKNEPDKKKVKLDNNGADGTPFSFSSLARENISEVGTAEPVKDYQTLIKNSDPATFRDASKQLMDRILQLVNDSFLDQYYRKALECLKILREDCMRTSEIEIFNEFMEKVKKTMMGQRRNDFWELVKTENTGLITAKENNKSTVSDEDASQFFGSIKEEKEEEAVPETQEDVDDLLDMM